MCTASHDAAAGVAIGAAADLYVEPSGAIAVGVFAGALSVLGYKYLMPYLDRTIGLKDTCGVHNLHGMPGILAAIVSAIVVAVSCAMRRKGGCVCLCVCVFVCLCDCVFVCLCGCLPCVPYVLVCFCIVC